MSYQFRGINQYVEAAAIERGFDPAIASPRTLLVSAAKAERLMTKVGDAIGQASTARPEHKAEIASRAIDILWMLGVMKEATEAALLELFTEYELDTTELMKVIDYAAGHSNGDSDRGQRHDVGATQDGRPSDRPRQPGIDQRRKS